MRIALKPFNSVLLILPGMLDYVANAETAIVL